MKEADNMKKRINVTFVSSDSIAFSSYEFFIDERFEKEQMKKLNELKDEASSFSSFRFEEKVNNLLINHDMEFNEIYNL